MGSGDARFLGRLLALLGAGLLLILAWRAAPLLLGDVLGFRAEPRAITPRGELAADERSTIAVFQARRDSVVSIATVGRAVDPWTRNPLQVPRGTGSGFVWDALGHIVTNHHVVAGASGATVQLANGRTYPAALVGASPQQDLAVLRIGVGGLGPEPLPIGTSADLQVGQKVLAIGNPFGLDWTLTTGIISALDRELPTETGAVIGGLIQTDAAINPGNSGGPLLDSAGRLIGVNTAIFSPSGAYAGIGFAVPVDTVNRIVPRLIATGRDASPGFGVRMDARINAALAARLGTEGVHVLGVEPGSAADRLGLRPARITEDGGLVPGDVILALGETPVRQVGDLRAALDRLAPGEAVAVTVLRDGRRLTLRARPEGGG